MKTIEYATYGTPEVLEIMDREKPVPAEHEILIKIRATTVTAVDSIFRKGDQFFARIATGIIRPKIPTLGTEFSGEVEQVGSRVTRFKPGDAVFGDSSETHGTHAEYLCLPDTAAVSLKPANLTFEQAAAVPYGALTALHFLRDVAEIREGQQVLINGASGAVGSYAVQLAHYFGAIVTGVCSTGNVEVVKSLGADHVIDYKKEDFTTAGEKYDLVFDTVGKSSFPQGKKALKPGGLYLTTVIGVGILWQMARTSVIGKKKAVIAFAGLRPTSETGKDLEFVKRLLEQEKLTPLIDRTYPVNQIREAHAFVDKGHKKGSVVITM